MKELNYTCPHFKFLRKCLHIRDTPIRARPCCAMGARSSNDSYLNFTRSFTPPHCNSSSNLLHLCQHRKLGAHSCQKHNYPGIHTRAREHCPTALLPHSNCPRTHPPPCSFPTALLSSLPPDADAVAACTSTASPAHHRRNTHCPKPWRPRCPKPWHPLSSLAT
jgi:hypothetical protein